MKLLNLLTLLTVLSSIPALADHSGDTAEKITYRCHVATSQFEHVIGDFDLIVGVAGPQINLGDGAQALASTSSTQAGAEYRIPGLGDESTQYFLSFKDITEGKFLQKSAQGELEASGTYSCE